MLPTDRIDINQLFYKTGYGLYLLDKDNRFVYMNSIAEEFLGVTQHGFYVGKYIFEEFPHAEAIRNQMERARSGEYIQFEYDSITRPDKWVGVKIFALDDYVAVMFDDRSAQKRAERELIEEQRIQALINETNAKLIGKLDPREIVDILTKASVEITNAEFGAYFDISTDHTGQLVWKLASLTGAPIEAFTRLGNPRATSVFKPTFESNVVIRSDDILEDPRYGDFGGMPKGHLPVRSYLAVPLLSKSGKPKGAILLGHREPKRFSARTETMLTSIALQAAVVIENAELYASAQKEIEERVRIEARQQVLMGELSHRVKNILATIQAIATSTVRNSANLEEFHKVFLERLVGISQTNDLLIKTSWTSASLEDIVRLEIGPYGEERFEISGPKLLYGSKAVLALAMAFHELITNAAKYGALSTPTGRIRINWTVEGTGEDARVHIQWEEVGGPLVEPPTRKGFGTKLIQAILASTVNGTVDLKFEEPGLICTIDMQIKQTDDISFK